MRLLLVVTFLITVLFAGVTTWYKGHARATITAKQEKQVSQQRIETVAKQIEAAKAELIATVEQRRQLNVYLPPEQEINTFFAFVNGVGAEHHVSPSFVFSQGQSTSAITGNGELPLTLNITSDGGIEPIVNFLTDLEQSTYRMTIRNAGLGAQTTAATPGLAAGQPASPGITQAAVELILYVNKTTN
jgi:hypothetical protein